MNTATNTVEDFIQSEYKYGFVTDIEADTVAPGLNEDVIRLISAKKNEPTFMLEWRLKAYRHWVKLEKSQAEPKWPTSIIRPSTIKRSATTRRRSSRPMGRRA